MNCKKLIQTVLLVVLSQGIMYTQDSIVLVSPFNDSFTLKSKFVNESEMWDDLIDLRHTQMGKGYMEFSIDSVVCEADTCRSYFFDGLKYKFGSLSLGNQTIAHKTKRQTNRFSGKDLSEEGLKALFQIALSEYENNGYPFSSIKLSDVQIEDSILNAVIFVDPKKHVSWDSVVVKTEGKANGKYLSRYLGILPGHDYDESAYRQVERKLNELSFLKSKKNPEVLFTKEGAILYLYVEDKRANSFNGIIGFQPNEQNGRINITGDLEILLVNKLNQGERLKLNWKRLASLSQNLDVQFTYPYLFNTDLGINAGINLFRRDTTFSQVQSNAGLQYKTGASSYLEVFIENDKSTRLSTLSTDLVLADISTLYYGVGILKDDLDYKFNPRRGYSTNVKFGVGTRKVRGIEEDVNAGSVTNTQYKAQLGFSVFLPVLPRSTLLLRTNSFWMSGTNHFENEMFRFGGVKTLRGFDESSFYASSLAIGTIEFRYLLDQNSNLHVFFDQAWYEGNVPQNFITDTPYGFGAGVSFQTNAGVFSFSYALGSQQSNPILFKNGKIHFGFTNFF